jgi:hypothetical protein
MFQNMSFDPYSKSISCHYFHQTNTEFLYEKKFIDDALVLLAYCDIFCVQLIGLHFDKTDYSLVINFIVVCRLSTLH